MKDSETIFDESLTRREFVLQAGAINGGLALHLPLLHLAEVSAAGRTGITELSRGWYIKSIFETCPRREPFSDLEMPSVLQKEGTSGQPENTAPRRERCMACGQ